MTASDPASPTRRSHMRGGMVGAGAAACAVCCAAPVLTLLGIGATGAAATALTVTFAGLVLGVVVAIATVAAVLVRRRTRWDACGSRKEDGVVGPVSVELVRVRSGGR